MFDACGGAAASSGSGVRPAIPAGMRAPRMRARASSEPRGVEHPRRRWAAAGSVSGVSSARAGGGGAAAVMFDACGGAAASSGSGVRPVRLAIRLAVGIARLGRQAPAPAAHAPVRAAGAARLRGGGGAE